MRPLHPLVVSGVLALATHAARSAQRVPELLGRWVGESECVGAHPACHAEHVVYRIDSAGARALRVDGARIAGRDTIDMGALDCRIGAGRTAGRADAVCRVPLGVWRFRVTRDRLEGSLTLADSTVARHVVARRLTSH